MFMTIASTDVFVCTYNLLLMRNKSSRGRVILTYGIGLFTVEKGSETSGKLVTKREWYSANVQGERELRYAAKPVRKCEHGLTHEFGVG